MLDKEGLRSHLRLVLEQCESLCCDSESDRLELTERLVRGLYGLIPAAYDEGARIGAEDAWEEARTVIRRLRKQLDNRAHLIIKLAWRLV